MKLKRTILLLIFIFAGLFIGCASDTYVEIATGGADGSYYKVGKAIADTLDDNLDTMVVAAEPGYGPIANCFLIKDGRAQVAMVESNIAHWAYNGEEMFEGQAADSLRVIAALYPHPIHIVTLTGKEIDQLADLNGKRVCVGEVGSAMYLDALNVLEASYTTVDQQTISYQDGLYKLEEGEMDAVIMTAAEPNASIVDVTETHTILLIPMEEIPMKTLLNHNPFYTDMLVEAEIYKSIDDEISTAATMTLLVCSSDMDSDSVYRLTKAMWENIEAIRAENDQAEKISFATAMDGVSIPVHPGAQKYYDELADQAEE